jgi:uncharacterized beta-barrel protein YwiB (DUF1934 family)
MDYRKKVSLTLTSTTNGEAIEQKAPGELFFRNGLYYLRYNEQEPSMGQTVTTMKCLPNELRVIRHGDITSTLSYQLDQRKRGMLQTPQVSIEVESLTHQLIMDLGAANGSIRWSYDLFINGELAGTYELVLKIQEEM